MRRRASQRPRVVWPMLCRYQTDRKCRSATPQRVDIGARAEDRMNAVDRLKPFKNIQLVGPVSNFVFKAYDAPKEDVCLANRKPSR